MQLLGFNRQSRLSISCKIIWCVKSGDFAFPQNTNRFCTFIRSLMNTNHANQILLAFTGLGLHWKGKIIKVPFSSTILSYSVLEVMFNLVPRVIYWIVALFSCKRCRLIYMSAAPLTANRRATNRNSRRALKGERTTNWTFVKNEIQLCEHI